MAQNTTPEFVLSEEILDTFSDNEYTFGEYVKNRISDSFTDVKSMDIYLKDRSPMSFADSLKNKGFSVSLQDNGSKDGFFKADIIATKNGSSLTLNIIRDESNKKVPFEKGKETVDVHGIKMNRKKHYEVMFDGVDMLTTVQNIRGKKFTPMGGFNDSVRNLLEGQGFQSTTPLPVKFKLVAKPAEVAPQVQVNPAPAQVSQQVAASGNVMKDAVKAQQKQMEPLSFKDRYLQHATEAAFDTAAEQLISNTRKAILKIMEKAGKDNAAIEMAKTALESPVGYAALGLALGEALSHVPVQKLASDPRTHKLANKLIQKGMSHGMNAGINTVVDTILPVLAQALQTLPEVEVEEQAKQLNQANLRVSPVASQKDEVTELAELQAQLEQTASQKKMAVGA